MVMYERKYCPQVVVVEVPDLNKVPKISGAPVISDISLEFNLELESLIAFAVPPLAINANPQLSKRLTKSIKPGLSDNFQNNYFLSSLFFCSFLHEL
jgi:hypothetical protein